MRYVNITRQELEPHMSATLSWLEHFDHNLNDVEICLRDTDHAYESLRVELAFQQYDAARSTEIEKIINEYVDSHCCLCGSSEGVSIWEYDSICSSKMLNTFCKNCTAKKLLNDQDLYSYLKYSFENNCKITMNPKIKIRFNSGEISYCRLQEIEYNNGTLHKKDVKNSFYSRFRSKRLIEQNSFSIIGADTGLRDINDERAYDGDIIICKDINERKFGGMLLSRPTNWGKTGKEPNPQWFRYSVCHGYGNFPSSLSWAKNFKIVGSIGDVKVFNGFGANEVWFEKWLNENKELFNDHLKD